MNTEPQKEHQWLHRLVGEWSYEGECSAGPDKPPERFQGSETVRSLGGLWVLCEGRGEMPGGGLADTLMTLGYDPQKQRYIGTWVGSMMTHLWIYEGSLDPEERVLTLRTEGPTCTEDGRLARFKDVIEMESDERRVLKSYMLGDDGQWNPFMTAHYRRKT
jgi:hypothetical protein